MGVQQGRRVPIKLQVEAQSERTVEKILEQAKDKIMVWELLGLLPDLLSEIWGIWRLPLSNKMMIPSTQAGDIGLGATVATTSVEGPGNLQGVRVEVRTISGFKETGGFQKSYISMLTRSHEAFLGISLFSRKAK